MCHFALQKIGCKHARCLFNLHKVRTFRCCFEAINIEIRVSPMVIFRSPARGGEKNGGLSVDRVSFQDENGEVGTNRRRN